jgi:hypothetical protein
LQIVRFFWVLLLNGPPFLWFRYLDEIRNLSLTVEAFDLIACYGIGGLWKRNLRGSPFQPDASRVAGPLISSRP